MIHVRYPGKLYIMGEYVIMEPGNHAVLISVNRYLDVHVKKADTLQVTSAHGTLKQGLNGTLPYVEDAIKVAQEYLVYHHITPHNFEMDIESELDAGKNKKYGFGSSGVVIVGVIDALLKLHNLKVDPETLFKLAVYTQVKMNKISSGGDLACSIYGGLVHYRRYKELPSKIEDIDTPWAYLEINPLQQSFEIEVGYTGSGFDSHDFLSKVKKLKETDPVNYQYHIDKGNQIVKNFIQNPHEISYIQDYRDWMLEFASWADIQIESHTLTHLIETALELGYVSKVSGAGGGDCGIAIYNETKDKALLESRWATQKIERIENIQ